MTAAEDFLIAAGAADLPHPGGTLLEHLRRVADALAGWGASPDVQLAGLCHATYGTDGFDVALLDTSERAELGAVIGGHAESLVYLYGSCDRDAVYPHLGRPGPVAFRDRFTGAIHQSAADDTRAFVEITVANELDVMTHNAELRAKYGAGLMRLFTEARHRMSNPAWEACELLLGR